MASLKTVLLVEDDSLLLEALALTLHRRGYQVLSASDGEKAAALIAEQIPDIAVFDMMLPGQSGFQLASLLVERSDGRVPIVMMSANSSAAHRDYAFAAGVDRFLIKPFATGKLVEAVETLCPPRPIARINSPALSQPAA
jgi:DNA-binding response OmpR family regulator